METNNFEDKLKEIGTIVGVGEDWYILGEPETNEDGTVRYGVYAINDEVREKMQKVFDKIAEEQSDE